MIEQTATLVAWVAFILWKIIVILAFPLIVLFLHQGYPTAYRKIIGYEYQQTGELVRRQIIWRLLLWLAVIALGMIWLNSVDRRLLEIVVSVGKWLDPITS